MLNGEQGKGHSDENPARNNAAVGSFLPKGTGVSPSPRFQSSIHAKAGDRQTGEGGETR